MTPYASFSYFGILLLLVVVPTIVLGFLGKKPKSWLIIATSGMLIVQYAWPVVGKPESPFWHELATLVVFTVFQWAVAAGYAAWRRRQGPHRGFPVFLVLALSPMVSSKMLPFEQGGGLIGFVGISYLTFRAVDVLICLKDGTVKELTPSTFLMFLLFFPTVSSGPLDRYRRFEADWHAPRTTRKFLDDFDHAASCFFTGMLYKFVLAAIIYDRWLGAVKDSEGFLAVVSYMYAYSFYLFFDFAGYSAFAIAFSYLLGIRTPPNFYLPFLAPDIQAFWNRWHISLSHWFRDHVFMRFQLWAAKRKLIRNPVHAAHLGLMLTFLTMGLWHGIERHFVAYGLYHGVLQVAHDHFKRWNKSARLIAETWWARAIGTALTFQCVCFGFLIFSGHLFR
jgi:D-alanyl-lipoteichoic acid biosynthesis protein DltB